MSTVPKPAAPFEPSSRLVHGLGTARLAQMVAANNNFDEHQTRLLVVSALLHDAGSPPFSHLTEPWLKATTGHNGESFVADMLQGSKTERVIDNLGLSLVEIAAVVTGQSGFSKVLNGSMDIDNLDNVVRFWHMATGGSGLYNPGQIASGFKFDRASQKWRLQSGVFSEVRKWQAARRLVYRLIYSSRLLAPETMLCRAVDLAFENGLLSLDFFKLNDSKALKLLGELEISQRLVEALRSRRFYQEIFSFETTSPPSEKFLRHMDRAIDMRSMMPNYIREQVKIPADAICVYVGKGCDSRQIDLDFVRADGFSYPAPADPQGETVYRIRVFLDPNYIQKKDSVIFWTKWMTDLAEVPEQLVR